MKIHKNKIDNYQGIPTKKWKASQNIKKVTKLESYQINHGKIQNIYAKKVSLLSSYTEITFF